MKSVLLILSLWCALSAASSLGHAPIQLPPRYPSFKGCATGICHEGNYTGYGCMDGRCIYVCIDGMCNGYSGTREFLFPQTLKDLTRRWAPGARNVHGCKGNNCGFWGGCNNGYCVGRYDFRGCGQSNCQHGPFRGFGCDPRGCQVICYDRRCHIDTLYGDELSVDRIDMTLPRRVSELKRMDLSSFVEVENDLLNITSEFWQFYMNNPDAWERDKYDSDLWAYLYDSVGSLRLKGPIVQMPGDGCDPPQCGYQCSHQCTQ